MRLNSFIKHYFFVWAASLVLLLSCSSKKPATLFTLLPAEETGISFTNTIQENAEFNVMTYQYLYN
ncbi:MAG TPA: hypothetical protein VEZ55_02685, partial [Chitinophagaceae bacterium]|nr:hypothetical protein [Chitinophagaceae bacterium]